MRAFQQKLSQNVTKNRGSIAKTITLVVQTLKLKNKYAVHAKALNASNCIVLALKLKDTAVFSANAKIAQTKNLWMESEELR